MRRFIGGFCALIVGLQILVGVPLLVCAIFFALAGGGIGPIAVQVHAGPEAPPSLVVAGHSVGPSVAPAIALPPNLIPPALPALLDNPILTSRAEHGSPLAGTVLGEAAGPEAEQQLFVAALQKVVAEATDSSHCPSESVPCGPRLNQPATEGVVDGTTAEHGDNADDVRAKATEFAIDQLYAMAERDEQARQYDRADQWRSLARDLRRERGDSGR